MTANKPRCDCTADILVVGPEDVDLALLRQIFEVQRWPLFSVTTLAGAAKVMIHSRPSLLLCEAHLDDGDWKSMLTAIEATGRHPPLLIVTSRQADDDLWAEVLNLGGYDVLAKPYDADEVIRVVSLAWERAACVHRQFVTTERSSGLIATDVNPLGERERGS